MARQELPVTYCFIVEGEGSVDVIAPSYGDAVSALERRVGRNLYGKFYLEKEIRNGSYYYRNR